MPVDVRYIYDRVIENIEAVFQFLYHYFDVYYVSWLAWVFYPLIVTLILPLTILLLVYASALFLHLYRLRKPLQNAVQDAVQRKGYWDSARRIIAAVWDAQGKIWHGYEIVGLERIPNTGPALLIYYHGAIPIDFYYIMAKVILYKNRVIRAVGDRFLFRTPGFKLLMEVMHVLPGTVSKGVELLNDGHLLAISPGGVREAFFSDNYYKLLWGKRVGFAKIALEANVPVIPIFTMNCREAFRTPSVGRSWFQALYEKTRLPLVPIYGGFPVKMRTFIGKPVNPDPSQTPEELANKVKGAIEELIEKHQQIPGTIVEALLERFHTPARIKQD